MDSKSHIITAWLLEQYYWTAGLLLQRLTVQITNEINQKCFRTAICVPDEVRDEVAWLCLDLWPIFRLAEFRHPFVLPSSAVALPCYSLFIRSGFSLVVLTPLHDFVPVIMLQKCQAQHAYHPFLDILGLKKIKGTLRSSLKFGQCWKQVAGSPGSLCSAFPMTPVHTMVVCWAQNLPPVQNSNVSPAR